ncbi:hypothetical protein XA68_17646 [Ophiocordyceps unilateralis]|uniref:Uncharacterized protein n=1 Tax=Ophiocordyceps unilateralis TaxID=268505 RepID=A0A2A9P4I3_OPHUN|nr:hypothetical protein XA68_17646 [Ophiocordyceps unilateralis]
MASSTTAFGEPDDDGQTRHAEEEADNPMVVEGHDAEQPTASHALADESIRSEPTELKGASQMEHDAVEVKNLGWNDMGRHVPQQIMGGLRNDELWTLIRRFDKFVFRVRSIPEAPLATLDMNVADQDDFSPEKLRATLERLYMTVLISLLSGWKHIARLRSWREYRRTAAFLVVYATAWLYDLLVPTLAAFAMTLILHPRSRAVCFPPVPPALVDAKTGGLQKPAAGILASRDSMTGAPEKHRGEGVEQEAHNFINTLSTVAISATIGKHPQGDPHEDTKAPDPTRLADGAADVKDKTNGHQPNGMHDQTREPVSRAVWSKARPAMHLVGNLVDTWERFANALSPTRPFPRHRPRLVLAASLVPVLLAWWLVTPYMFLKGLGFTAGFGLFGDPVVALFIAVADRSYPSWHRYVQLRNTILRGVPTNAQLTITLLRIGERNKAPLPPPPKTTAPPKAKPDWGAAEQLDNLGVTEEEKREAMMPTAEPPQLDDDDDDDTRIRGTQTRRRLFNLLKRTARGGVAAALTADKAKAVIGAQRARERLGVVRQPSAKELGRGGPVRFPARYRGDQGDAYVTSTATAPALSWRPKSGRVDAVWTVAIGDIDQINKVGGLGWKSKMVVGWALDSQIVDGLVVRTKQGVEYHLTAVVVRDELFNRLIAIGSQMWEAW